MKKIAAVLMLLCMIMSMSALSEEAEVTVTTMPVENIDLDNTEEPTIEPTEEAAIQEANTIEEISVDNTPEPTSYPTIDPTVEPTEEAVVELPDPKKVELADSKTVTAYIGTPITLEFSVSPADADITKLKWTSSSKKIAVVDNGTVTPVKEGSVTITVKAPNGKKDTVKVKVVDPKKPTKVELDATGTLTLNIDQTLQLNAVLQPDTAESTLKWSTSNKKYATVDANGVVTPVKEGTVTITVKTHNGKKDTVKVKVVDPYKPTSVVLAESGTVKLNMGETLQLNAALKPDTAKSTLKWSTSNKKYATVDANGVVTPVKEGTVTITVKTHNGKKDTVKVKVVDPYKPTSVVLAESGTVKLNMGETLQLNAALKPETAKSTLKWSTSNKKYATVDANGVVTPVKEGTVTITVKTHNGKKDTVKVKVVDPYKPTSVVLAESGTVKLNMGETLQLNAALKPDTAKSTLKWSTSNKKYATVDANGVVTPVKEGTVTITVKTHNGKKDTVKVKVVDPYKPTSVVLAESGTVKLNMGETLQLNAALKPDTAKSMLKWSTSNKKYATVDANGVVTPVKEGTVTITVKTHNGKKDTVKVKVVDPYKPTSVVLAESGTITMSVGDKLQLNAEIKPDTAISELKWSSSNKKYATVDGNGVVTAVKAGTATITVKTRNGKTDTVKVKVGEKTWTPDPSYVELKTALSKSMWHRKDGWAWGDRYDYPEDCGANDPLVKAISGAKLVNRYYDDVCHGDSGTLVWATENVQLIDIFGEFLVVLKPGAEYTICGFTPDMTMEEVELNVKQRSDVRNSTGIPYSNGDGTYWILYYTDVKCEYYDSGYITVNYYPRTGTIESIVFHATLNGI